MNEENSQQKISASKHKATKKNIFRKYILAPATILGGVTLAVNNVSPSLVGGLTLSENSFLTITHNNESREGTAPYSHSTWNQTNTTPPHEDSAQPSLGSCLTGESPIPCDTIHNREVIGYGNNCTLDLAYEYTKGNPSYDFFAPEVSIESLNDLCILTIPHRESSIHAAWASTSSGLDSLRLCFAGEQASARFVNCSESHIGEIVYQQSAQDSSQLNCESRAEEYANLQRKFWQNDLKVSQHQSNDKFYCILETRNGKDLKTQLRNVGNSKIEIG